MAKPSIGTAVTTAAVTEKKEQVKELTVLTEESKESIYYLVFSKTEKGGMKENE